MRLSESDKQDLELFIIDHLTTTLPAKINEHVAAVSSAVIAEAVSIAIKPLTDEISGLRELLEETRDQNKALQERLIEKDDRIKTLETSLKAAVQRNVELKGLILEKADDAEARSRKDILRISGIPTTPDENNDTLKAAVIEKLNKHGVELKETDIFHLHRCGKSHPMNKFIKYINYSNDPPIKIDPADKTETAETMIRFTNWTARQRVYSLHYEKNLDIRVKTDLTKYRQDILESARQHLSDHNLKGYVTQMQRTI